MNVLIFTCFEKYNTTHKIMNEFLVKNLSLFNLFDYNVTILDRTQNNIFYDSCNEIIDKDIKKVKSIDDIDINDYDFYYTFGNFISFEKNKIKGKEFKITEDDFPENRFHKLSFNYYQQMCEFILENDVKVHQFMSDPLDFVYPNTTLLTPDTEKTNFWDDTLNYHQDNIVFFPLYQYSHHIVSKAPVKDKDLTFICGNTIFDKDREIEFNTYMLNMYEKEKDNDKYNFLIKGYKNYKYSINTFVTHNEFFDLCSRTKFGLVIKTYSDSIISSNKFHTFLSKDCLPILVKGCDEDSNYIPKELKEKLTVSSGLELLDFINNTDVTELLNELKNYFVEYEDINFYKDKLELKL